MYPNRSLRRRHLSIVIGALCGVLSFQSVGRDLEGPAVHVVVPGDVPEAWRVLNGASLTVNPAAATLGIYASNNAKLTIQGGQVTAAGNAVSIYNGSQATIADSSIFSSSPDDAAIVAGRSASEAGSELTSVVDIARSSVSGGLAGIVVGAGNTVNVAASNVSGLAADSFGLWLLEGTSRLTQGSTVTGATYGVLVESDVRIDSGGGRTLIVDGSHVEGGHGAAIAVLAFGGADVASSIQLNNGARLTGGNGVAVEAGDGTLLDVSINNSAIVGDIVTAAGGSTNVGLLGGGSLAGRMLHANHVSVGVSSEWRVTGDSDVASLSLDHGTVAFAPAADGSFRALTVHGGFGGDGGSVRLNTVLDEGGALSAQRTDRLLIEGDVASSGTTLLHVVPAGEGGSTDRNGDGVADAGEGISLVQVGGQSRADAFALAGGYVAAGPWQYTLHAFGPGSTDPAQNALAGGGLAWDYRLASLEVCEHDCGPVDPVDPGTPDPGDGNGDGGDTGVPGTGGEGPDSRVAVVPQVPSYISAPAALLSYGDMLADGLHQRLGDIRNGKTYGALGGELFARYVGGQYRYNSDRSFQQYGYDFDQQVNALQVGGNVLAVVGDASTLRAGWALDHGTTRITPKAVDGESHSKFDANGVSAWMTWQADNGFYVDGVVGNTRYNGTVGTSLRGEDVARVRANAWHASVEAGIPFAIAENWSLEPQVQVKHQALTFRDFRDADDLDVRLGTVHQTTTRVGAMLTRTGNAQFMPYARLDLSHTGNGQASAHVSSEAFNASAQFAGGRMGNAWRGALGATAQLTPHVQLYGEGNYQHFVGNYGMQGWTANAGVRVTF